MSAHVTVGYDGTPDSEEAVRWAAAEAAARAVALHIVSSYPVAYTGDPWSGYLAAEAIDAAQQATETSLEAIRATVVGANPGLEVTTHATGESAQTALLDDVAQGDVLVVGASRHTGAAAFWLGSTPRALARRSPCPVVVVRGSTPAGPPRSVVVGVDGSGASDEALEWACTEATLHGAGLVVVHAWHYPYGATGVGDSQARDMMRIDANQVLAGAVEFARQRVATGVTDVLVEGNSADAILDTVAEGDLLVLGSRGRGAVAAGLFGSTVHSVLERASVPVAVVRHQAE